MQGVILPNQEVTDVFCGGQRPALLQTIAVRAAFSDELTPTWALPGGRTRPVHCYDQLFLGSHDVDYTEIANKLIEL